MVKQLRRAMWKKWSGYHCPSLVETKMHCIKLLVDKLSARSFYSLVNAIHARVAVFNKCTELGQPHYPSCHLNLSRLKKLCL